MERKILFRGRDYSDKWHFGNLLCRRDKSPVPETTQEYEEFYIQEQDFLGEEVEVDSSTIGQYTGLTDKEGNKIFEGDILSGQNCRFVVKYDERQAEFVAVNSTLPKGFGLPMSQTWINETNKIICGNVHDNPEFIK